MVAMISACATSKKGGNEPFKLINAESRRYVLGKEAPDGKTSGNMFTLNFESKGNVEIVRLWIDGINIDFETVLLDEEGSFRVRATFYDANQKNQHPNIVAPITYTGRALVEYKYNNEVKHYVVKDFVKYQKVPNAK